MNIRHQHMKWLQIKYKQDEKNVIVKVYRYDASERK